MNEFERQLMEHKATGIVDAQPELKEQSDLREKYKFQREIPFKGGAVLSNEDTERRPCKPKEKEWLDKSLEKLGDLFADADFFWQLDGGLTISLYCGKYIGVHKDIDISVDSHEIEKVGSFLDKKGFGFFLSTYRAERNEDEFERVDAKHFVESQGKQHYIIAMDENGAIKHGKGRFAIDTHVITWNENGEPISATEIPIPREWLKPGVMRFHEKNICCAHPAWTAFHKLFFTRAYDDNDLKLLAESGGLSTEDVDLIEKTFDTHSKVIKDKINDFCARVLPKIENEDDEERVFNILINDEIVRGQDNQETIQFFRDLAEELLKNNNRTKEGLSKYIFSTASIGKLTEQKDARIAILRDNISHK